MILKKISLSNFRNFKNQELVFNRRLTIVAGENSRGKTNLLEAIYFVLKGQGFREEKEEELINLNFSRGKVTAVFEDNGADSVFEIDIDKSNGKTVKIFFVDRTKKRLILYKKELTSVVLFTPDQINIIKGAPSLRREYFNAVLSERDDEYKKHLNNFENALRRRNRILEKHVSEIKLRDELSFWNDYLEKESRYITEKRSEYVVYLNNHKKLDSKMFSISYLRNDFSKKNLTEVFPKEMALRKTLIGPQKDDFDIIVQDATSKKDIHRYGSRSEERLAVFWLKINELRYFENELGKPILLLDDIFSELDYHNKKIILNLIGQYQTIASTTDEEFLKEIKSDKEIINL